MKSWVTSFVLALAFAVFVTVITAELWLLVTV